MVRTISAKFSRGGFEPLEPAAIYADRLVTTRPDVRL
jgi:hypothetical protein